MRLRAGQWRWATIKANRKRAVFQIDRDGDGGGCFFARTGGNSWWLDELTDISEPIIDPKKPKPAKRKEVIQ